MYKRFLGILVIGVVIKFMDDFLDKKIDNILDNKNYAVLMGNSIFPYTLLLMILALYLNFEEATTYFAASYVTGMAQDYNEKLPSHILAWQESLLVFLFSIIFISFYETIYAIILIFFLQLIDDFIDYQQDNYINDFNYIKLTGIIPGFILIIILSLISIKFFPLKLIYFCTAVIILYLIDYFVKQRLFTAKKQQNKQF